MKESMEIAMAEAFIKDWRNDFKKLGNSGDYVSFSLIQIRILTF